MSEMEYKEAIALVLKLAELLQPHTDGNLFLPFLQDELALTVQIHSRLEILLPSMADCSLADADDIETAKEFLALSSGRISRLLGVPVEA